MDQRKISDFLSGFIRVRLSIVEAILIAVFLGVAVSLASNHIFSVFSGKYWLMWVLVLLLFLLVATYIVKGLFKNINFKKKYSAVCCIDKNKEKNFVDIVLYNFNSSIFEILKSLWRADKEERIRWCNEGIILNSSEVLFSPWQVNIIKKSPDGELLKNIINSRIEMASEIIALRAISDSFVRFYSKENKVGLARNIDIAECENIVENNLFLKKVFSSEETFSLSYKGDRRDYISLFMPEGTSIYKKDGFLYIETYRLLLKIFFDFSGVKNYESEEFYLFYLKKDFLSVDMYKMNVYMSAEVKRKSILDFGDWWEIGWLEYIDAEMDKVFDFEKFKSRVNFDALLANIFVMRNVSNLAREKMNG